MPEWMDRTPSPKCVNCPPDVLTLYLQSDPLACYRAARLTVEGVIRQPGDVDCFMFLEPAWLSCPYAEGWLSAIMETADAGPSVVLAATSSGRGGGPRDVDLVPPPLLSFVVHPDSGISVADYYGMRVSVTGHYDDPAAETCRITADHSGSVTPAEAIETCRNTFVVTRMVLTSP